MINTKIAAVHESQLALTTLMEGISTRLDTVTKTEPPPEELVDAEAERLVRAWDWNVSGVQSQPMERLSTILEVTSTKEETASVDPMSGIT